jgi:recombination protein RecA
MSLKAALAQIEKKYGENKVMLASEATGLAIRRISSGSLALDIEIGGGWAQGKIHEIYGPFSSAKTYLALLTVATNMKKYPDAKFAWVPFEPFDIERAEQIGVDLNRLLITEAEYMEQGFDIAEALIKSGELFMIVIDSWGAACPKAELEGDMEAFTVGLRARIGNKFIRKIAGANDKLTAIDVDLGNTTILILNQVYQGIGPYASEETPGGRAVGFFSVIRVRVRKKELEPKDEAPVAQETAFVVEKNKTFAPKKRGSFWFCLVDNKRGKAGEIWRFGEILEYGIIADVITRGGAMYYYGEHKLKGQTELKDFFYEHPEELEKVEKAIMERLLINATVPV